MICLYGLVAQFGWSVRLITERSRVQISPGPLLHSPEPLCIIWFSWTALCHRFRIRSWSLSQLDFLLLPLFWLVHIGTLGLRWIGLLLGECRSLYFWCFCVRGISLRSRCFRLLRDRVCCFPVSKCVKLTLAEEIWF